MTTTPKPSTKARTTPPRRDTLNLRIPSVERSLIDRAAAVRGTTRTDFVLGAARRAAEETLLDQVMFHVGDEAYKEFIARLDAPAKPNDRLRRTMEAPSPWDPR